eukprot:9688119-Lingulodinium_polyedra.AAC.1
MLCTAVVASCGGIPLLRPAGSTLLQANLVQPGRRWPRGLPRGGGAGALGRVSVAALLPRPGA